jgi:hypothetical protein
MQTHSHSIISLVLSGLSYRLSLYRHGKDHAENTVLLLRHASFGVPRDCYLGSPLARWLLPSNELQHCLLRHSYHCCTLKRVYRAVAWQRVDQIRYNTACMQGLAALQLLCVLCPSLQFNTNQCIYSHIYGHAVNYEQDVGT